MFNFKILFFSVFFAVIFGCTYAQPDMLRAVYTDDPSTKVTIVFNTGNSSNTNPVLYYGTNVSTVTNLTSPKAYRDATLSNASYGMFNNFVKLSNLIPDRKYYFKIKDNSGETQVYYFETIPDNPDKRLSFICGGDSRGNRTARQTANIIVSRLKPHAVFFDGDFTDNGNAEQWQDWFSDWQSTISNDGRVTPIVPARGNHENNNTELANLFGTNSTAYYSLSFGGNLFKAFTLNSENTIINYASQTDWLSNGLQTSQNYIYRFAQYHKPMRPHTGLKIDGASQYAFWAPLFYNYNVDLVLEGDAHTACTTYPIIPCTGGFGCTDGFKEDEVNGTVYTGQGTWGAPIRSSDDQRPWTFYGKMINQFKLIFVDKEKIELRTIAYENSTSINEVNINDRFNLPTGLSVEPGLNKLTGQSQDVLIIPSKKSLTYPKIEIALPSDNATYYNQVNSDIVIRNIATLNNINAVVFYLDGVNKGIDTSEPFSFKFDESEFSTPRAYEINAIAYDINGVPSPIAYKRIEVKSGTTHTVSSQLKDSFNDAEQSSNNRVDVSNYDLDMGYNGTICGLRFTNLNVPPGATILDASIQFTADERKLNPTDLIFYGEDNANSVQFLPSNYNISSRAKTPMSVNWSSVPNWENVADRGNNQKTPSLKTIVQHLVNRADWDIESPVTLIIEGTGYRVSETYDSDSTSTPILTVNYVNDNPNISGHCINHPDTINNVSIGNNIDIVGAGFSNLNYIDKVEFFTKSSGVRLKTENNNPSTLDYTIVGNETIIIKVHDYDDRTASKEVVIITDIDCNGPITPNVTAIKNNSAILSWANVPNTYYKVYHKALNENIWKSHCTPIPTMFLFGLDRCTDYQYKLQLICSKDFDDCNSDAELGYITSTKYFKTDCTNLKIESDNNEVEKENANGTF